MKAFDNVGLLWYILSQGGYTMIFCDFLTIRERIAYLGIYVSIIAFVVVTILFLLRGPDCPQGI